MLRLPRAALAQDERASQTADSATGNTRTTIQCIKDTTTWFGPFPRTSGLALVERRVLMPQMPDREVLQYGLPARSGRPTFG